MRADIFPTGCTVATSQPTLTLANIPTSTTVRWEIFIYLSLCNISHTFLSLAFAVQYQGNTPQWADSGVLDRE